MEMHTRPLAETVGNISGVSKLVNGQADTREYTEAERADEFNHHDRPQNLATAWEDRKVRDFLGQVDE